MLLIFIIKLSNLYYWKLTPPTEKGKKEMSEGKKTLVVTGDIDRMILQDQLKAAGFEAEVIVDRDAAGKIVGGLLSLPTTREEMLSVIGQTGYAGPYSHAAAILFDRIKEEIHKFTAIYPKSVGLRDKLNNLLREELRLPTELAESAGPGENMDQMREASLSVAVERPDLVPTLLTEILKELKGIKQPAPPKTTSTEDRAAIDEATRNFLTSPGLSVPNLVEGLRVITNFNAFVKDNSGILKAPQSKAEFINALTTVINDPSALQLMPPMALGALSKEDRQAIIDLLHPQANVVVGGLYDFAANAFTPDTIFETLLDSIEKGNGNVNFYGLNTLSPETLGSIRNKLLRALEKNLIKVAGGNKEAFVEGLVRALKDSKVAETNIFIQSVDLLTEDDTRELVNLLNGWRNLIIPLSNNVPLTLNRLVDQWSKDATEYGVQVNKMELLNYLIQEQVAKVDGEKSLGDAKYQTVFTAKDTFVFADSFLESIIIGLESSVGSIELNGLNNATQTERENLASVLKHLKGDNVAKVAGNTKATFTDTLVRALTVLLNPEKGWTSSEAKKDDGWRVLTQAIGGLGVTGLVIGNHVFDCAKRDDGSIKVTTRNGEGNNCLILNKDGTITLGNPGYLG